jgi:hypothetical protein
MPVQISPSVKSKNTENCDFFPAMAALPATVCHWLYTILATESVIKPNTWKVQQWYRDAITLNHAIKYTDLNNT